MSLAFDIRHWLDWVDGIVARIWSDRQLARATTPQAKDIRGKAFFSAINRLLGDRTLPGPHMRDPETCPAEVLPALIAEYSMEEFIEPGLPEHVVRRILKNRWALQTGEGYDAGVRLGLSLLGMRCDIEHWYQLEPKGDPNTHTITFYYGEQLFSESGVFRGREVDAAIRMVGATKRFSQETLFKSGERFDGTIHMRAGVRQSVTHFYTHDPVPRGSSVMSRFGARSGVKEDLVSRVSHDVKRRAV